ncbi:MAG TPA: two-component regulator propeller domain-containing protein, partial [Thermoanaerobaculia bacterium]|nr:two-component regulator propeller domain-containing protein [Thermoanaerobaculia bacterium]
MPCKLRPLLMLAAFLSLRLAAQELPFSHLTPSGQPVPLSSASVQKVIQDHQGYIWLGFYSSGLARYDGHSMEDYGLDDGLLDLTVRELAEDASHHLWAGTEAGLVVSEKSLDAYAPGERIRFTDRAGSVSIAHSRIRRNCVVAAPDGWVWVGTQDGIIRYRFDGARLETAPVDLSSVARPASVHAMFVRRDGSVVIGLLSGAVIAVDANGAVRGVIAQPPSPAGSFAETADGVLWGGSVDGTIWQLAQSSITPVDHTLNERIVALVSTVDGDIWAASLGRGAVRLTRGAPPLHVTRTNGLLGETLWTIFEDRERNLWFGQNGGVSRLRHGYRAFTAYTNESEPPLPDPSVFATLPRGLATGPLGAYLWAGTGGGLAAITETSIETLTVAQGLASNSVYALAADAKGRLWIGTAAGLNCLSMAGNEPPMLPGASRHATSLRATPVVMTTYGTTTDTTYAIRSAGNALYFAGAFGAAALIDDEWFLFRSAAGLPPAGATGVAIDDARHLWVSTMDHGLYRSDAPIDAAAMRAQIGGVTGRELAAHIFSPAWNAAHGAPTNAVRSIAAYGGKIWAGTSGGLGVIDPAQNAQTFAAKVILPGEPIVGMTLARDGRTLWVSQNAGLVEIDVASLQVRSRVTKADGLTDDEAWAYGPLGTGPEGRIYFATPSGLTIFDPSRRAHSGVAPIVRLRNMELTRGNGITIEYAALSYSDESRVRYRTRLVGYDDV